MSLLGIEKPISLLPDITDQTLKGAWLNKATYNSGKDYSPENNNLTIYGNPEPQRVGYKLNGTTDYFKKSITNFRSGDSEGTLEAWIEADTLGVNQIIFASADEDSTNYYLNFAVRDNNHIAILQKNADTYDYVYGSTTLVIGRRHHVVFVSTGTVWILYVDKNIESLTVDNGVNGGDWFAETSNRDNITIGAMERSSVVNYFSGLNAIVNYYSEAKSKHWVENRFESGVPE